ncbi:MAG: right-handed parallel beta-helix repeat-containing protein [Planctomycetes bacterium]|nr:right-handed parallel beta-helix repeat-containing protein [Planctomycetota bacterium]
MLRTGPHAFETAVFLLVLGLSGCSGGGGGGASGRLFVVPGGAGNRTGASWDDASGDLQAAIDAAVEGDEIWVAAGTYVPNVPAAPVDPRDARFRLKRGVTVRGGFAGHETSLAERPGRSTGRTLGAVGGTVLSGDLAGDDGPDFAGRDENAYHVVVAFDPEGSGTLEDVTIRGGHANGPGKGPSPDSRDQGSGLDVFNASPRIVRCTFEDNLSLNHGAANDHGVETVFEDCIFRQNRAEILGAGLYIHHHTETLAVGCLFEDNVAAQQGGGAYSRSHDAPLLQDCVFRGNRALQGGGLYVAPESTTQVVDCRFEANSAQVGGGGIYCDQSMPVIESSFFTHNEAGTLLDGGAGGGGGSGGGGVWAVGGAPLVVDCEFERNQASFGAGVYFIEGCSGTVWRSTFRENAAWEAGGLYILGSEALAEDCTFERNSASGGSFSVGGAVSAYFANAIVRRSTFVDNRAELGGGALYLEGDFPFVTDCVLIGNEAFGTHQGWGGGILYSFFCHGWVQNSLFLGNRAHEGGGLYAMAFVDVETINCTFVANQADVRGGPAGSSELSTPPLRNSITFGNEPVGLDGLFDARFCAIEGGYAGEGNLAALPSFVALPAPGADGRYGTADDELGNLRLAAGSAGIDAGDNDALLEGTELDLGGVPRRVDDPTVRDLGVPGAPVVDLGPYERSPDAP